MFETGKYPLILASASASRASLLRAAGLRFEQIPADLDEAAIRKVLDGDGAHRPDDTAELLARVKAETVSADHGDALVIGADQVLMFDGKIFEKPANMAAARATLLELAGGSHTLHAAVTVATNGHVIWSHVDTATLEMRDFSPTFVGRYLAAVGPRALTSVGAYQVEGAGIHLFKSVQGDHTTILGLPLLPLLAFLRQKQAIL